MLLYVLVQRERIKTIRDGEPRTAASTFTQFLSSARDDVMSGTGVGGRGEGRRGGRHFTRGEGCGGVFLMRDQPHVSTQSFYRAKSIWRRREKKRKKKKKER